MSKVGKKPIVIPQGLEIKKTDGVLEFKNKDAVLTLEMQGVGFRAALEGNTLVLNIGFSHPVRFALPEGVKVAIEKNNILISGTDKAMVGQIAAKIRAFKKPNSYLGTGIRYKNEVVKLKAGKKAASTTGAA